MARFAFLMLLVPLTAGCSTSSIKEKLLPKASVLGVSVVEMTPQQLTLKVDVKTNDVDLMLGMVKMKYKITILDSELGQQSENVPTTELQHLDEVFADIGHHLEDGTAGVHGAEEKRREDHADRI